MERNKTGQFVKGHPGIGGRPSRVEETEIREAMAAACDPKIVGEQLAAAIKRRESWAVTLWCAYYYGKPRERVEVMGADGGPLLLTIVEQIVDATERDGATKPDAGPVLPL